MKMSLEDSKRLTPSGKQEREDMHAVKYQAQQGASASFAPVKVQEQQGQQSSAGMAPVKMQDQQGSLGPVKVQEQQQTSQPTGYPSLATPAPPPVAATYAIPIPAMASTPSKPGFVPSAVSQPFPPPPPGNIPMAEVPMATEMAHPNAFSQLSYLDALALHLILGFFGALHFRMGRYAMGFIYLFTIGGFGVGWVVDLFRLPALVNDYNQKQGKLAGNESKATLVTDVYALFILWFFGGHHFYLKRTKWGFAYLFTVGFFGIGVIYDFFRAILLVDDYLSTKESRNSARRRPYLLSDAFLTWFPPAGLFGAHHLYLGNGGKFVLYFFTIGLFGVGWLFDLFRLSDLVQEANERMRIRAGLQFGTTEQATYA